MRPVGEKKGFSVAEEDGKPQRDRFTPSLRIFFHLRL
jgi:hypothetical protein